MPWQRDNRELTSTPIGVPWETPPAIRVWMMLLWYLLVGPMVSGNVSHQPFKWSLIQLEHSVVIQNRITPGAPSFTAHLSSLVRSYHGWAPIDESTRKYTVQRKAFYMCPANNPGKGYCNHPAEYYCAYWGCETIASEWAPGGGKDQFLTGSVQGGTCWHIYLNVSKPEDLGWTIGRTWGIRFWEPGTDTGGIILIKKEPVPNEPSGVGPNPVIAEEDDSNSIVHTVTISPNINVTENNTPGIPTKIKPSTLTPEVSPLWDMLQASYQVLNATYPNITKHCWLCYNIRPPFYEAIGVDIRFKKANETNPAQCLWNKESGRKQGITMSQVSGKGKCIGNVPKDKRHLCTTIHKSREITAEWLIPADNTKWICSQTGVTPCISLKVFNCITEYCIQVAVIPRLIYHPEDFIYDYQTTQAHHIQKREPFTALTVATLIAVGAAGAGTGITSLVQQNQKFQSLRIAVDEDLARIEKAMTALEQSVKSLSEVVLQNRRGLDLMFMQQGGLCAALREECCVYVDHTGVVRDTMAKLREGLEKRKKDWEVQQNWYESMFNYSPWLTTLLSTIAGPLILLILFLTFGPCIFNKLITIVKGRLEAAHLMLLRKQYEQIEDEGITPILGRAKEPSHIRD
uniref:Envelope glycoprotein n=1 Tax=Buteo japonicus TaxID=224669 RepID=A0A8C0BBW6_9AVES